jgi:hypothetical protein
MKVKTIVYQKVFPLGQYVNERIGVEMELDEHDKADDVFESAKAFVEGCHKPMEVMDVPSADFGVERQIVYQSTTQSSYDGSLSTEERLVQQINESSDLTVLKSFELLAKKNPSVKDAFDKRLKELQ